MRLDRRVEMSWVSSTAPKRTPGLRRNLTLGGDRLPRRTIRGVELSAIAFTVEKQEWIGLADSLLL